MEVNIVKALKTVKNDLLDFIIKNLQNKSDVTHTHNEYASIDAVSQKSQVQIIAWEADD